MSTSRPDEDRIALHAIRQGDAGALETLFRAYYTDLCAFAASIAGPAAAEDLVQDTFAAVWTQRHSLDVHTSVRAYLYGAVRNRALNHRRRVALERRRAAESSAAMAPDPPGDPLDALLARKEADTLRHAIATLPPRCREVIELRWRHQLTHAEIAATLGISRKGVEIQITRAMRALRTALGGEPP